MTFATTKLGLNAFVPQNCKVEKFGLKKGSAFLPFCLHNAVVASCWMVDAVGATVGPAGGGATVIWELASCVWKREK